MSLSCNNCFFWVQKTSGISVSGECRRLSPTTVMGQITPGGGSQLLAVFPITSSGTWCGGFTDLQSEWAKQMMTNIGRN